MNCIRIPDDLVKLNRIFAAHGHRAYLVGGAVRDALLRRDGHDWDLATDATPRQMMDIFRKVIPTGIAHGTVTIRIFGRDIEATTFRTEAGYADGRHPDAVAYAATIEEDLSRRDFTMNAVAADLGTGRLVDPFGGQDDIRAGIIRAVGSPLERFSEDGLRPVRAVRFAGQLGFIIEEKTREALSHPSVLARAAGISVERFRDELAKMLAVEKPSACLRLLEETGMLGIFMPEFGPCRGCRQADGRGFHEFDVADHLFYACDGAPAGSPSVRLAALYHDIGKPACRTEEGGRVHFYGHEAQGALLAERSLTALRFPADVVRRVCHLVREHMFLYDGSWGDAAVRRFLIRVGAENLDDLVALRLADIYGMHNCPPDAGSPAVQAVMELRDRAREALRRGEALGLRDLAVSGRDLIAAGIPAGRQMGAILSELFETVTDSPAMNERGKLLALALNIYAAKYRPAQPPSPAAS